MSDTFPNFMSGTFPKPEIFDWEGVKFDFLDDKAFAAGRVVVIRSLDDLPANIRERMVNKDLRDFGNGFVVKKYSQSTPIPLDTLLLPPDQYFLPYQKTGDEWQVHDCAVVLQNRQTFITEYFARGGAPDFILPSVFVPTTHCGEPLLLEIQGRLPQKWFTLDRAKLVIHAFLKIQSVEVLQNMSQEFDTLYKALVEVADDQIKVGDMAMCPDLSFLNIAVDSNHFKLYGFDINVCEYEQHDYDIYQNAKKNIRDTYKIINYCIFKINTELAARER